MAANELLTLTDKPYARCGEGEAIEPEILEPGARPEFRRQAPPPFKPAKKRGLAATLLLGLLGIALALTAGVFVLAVVAVIAAVMLVFGLVRFILGLFGLRTRPPVIFKTFRMGPNGFGH